MSHENMLTRIHPGMHVQSADGQLVGKIHEIWIGADPLHSSDRCDEEACSRLEVHHGAHAVYIPYNAIAEVAGKAVRLAVDAATVNEKGWYRKPLWIQDATPPEPSAEARDWRHLGHV